MAIKVELSGQDRQTLRLILLYLKSMHAVQIRLAELEHGELAMIRKIAENILPAPATHVSVTLESEPLAT